MFIAHQTQISSITAAAQLINYSRGTIRQLEVVPLSSQLEYTNPVFIIRTQNESQATVKWLDSLTASEHSLNLVAYYHTLTTETIVQLYSVQFGFV